MQTHSILTLHCLFDLFCRYLGIWQCFGVSSGGAVCRYERAYLGPGGGLGSPMDLLDLSLHPQL